MTDRILVVVPALNEEETIAAVIRDARETLGADVLVVDDGSRDRTALEAITSGAHLVQHPFNLGVGAAIRTGFRMATRLGYDRMVQLDADGQHPAEGAKALLAALDDGAAIAVGSRFEVGYEIGGARRLVQRVLARSVSKRVGVTLTDVTSGFRAFDQRAIGVFAGRYPSAWLSDTVEALLLAADEKLPVVEVSVHMRPRQGGVASSGTSKSLYHIARIAMVVALHRVRRPLPTRRYEFDVRR